MRQNTFKPSKKIPRKINKHALAVILCQAPTHWHARGHGFWVSSLKCRKKVGLESLKDPQGHTGEKFLHSSPTLQFRVLQRENRRTKRGPMPSTAI